MAYTGTPPILSKLLIGAGLSLVLFFALAIGPFTYFKDVVPYLAWALPKPDGAPSDASSGFDWKGFGLSWHWERELPSGCALWTMADERYVGVRLSPEPCGSQQASMSFSNFLRDDDIDFSPLGSRSFHCSIHSTDLSREEIALAAQLLREAQEAAKGNAESRLIELSQAFLGQPQPGEGEHPCGAEYAERLRAVGKWPEA